MGHRQVAGLGGGRGGRRRGRAAVVPGAPQVPVLVHPRWRRQLGGPCPRGSELCLQRAQPTAAPHL